MLRNFVVDMVKYEDENIQGISKDRMFIDSAQTSVREEYIKNFYSMQ